MSLSEGQIKYMVYRFLQWKLPENFNPDGGISFKKAINQDRPTWPQKNEPIGTNLFDADQTEVMVRYMIEGLPSASPEPIQPSSQGAIEHMEIASKLDHPAPDAYVKGVLQTSENRALALIHWEKMANDALAVAEEYKRALAGLGGNHVQMVERRIAERGLVATQPSLQGESETSALDFNAINTAPEAIAASKLEPAPLTEALCPSCGKWAKNMVCEHCGTNNAHKAMKYRRAEPAAGDGGAALCQCGHAEMCHAAYIDKSRRCNQTGCFCMDYWPVAQPSPQESALNFRPGLGL